MTNPNVLLAFPRFNPNSFWSLQAACDLWGARCPAPPWGLITLAALLPPALNTRLVNRNAEELSESRLDWADVVMIGGMLVQRISRGRLCSLQRVERESAVSQNTRRFS